MPHAIVPTDLSERAILALRQFNDAGVALLQDAVAADELVEKGCAVATGEPDEFELTARGRDMRRMDRDRERVR